MNGAKEQSVFRNDKGDVIPSSFTDRAAQSYFERDMLRVASALKFEPKHLPVDAASMQKSRQDELDITVLKNPPANLTNAVATTASRFNPNGRDIVTSILKVAYFFHLQDISQIAYVFATLAAESRFGADKIEHTKQSENHWYEPVMTAEGIAIKEDDKNQACIEAVIKLIAEYAGLLYSLVQNKEPDKALYQEMTKQFKTIGSVSKDDKDVMEWLDQLNNDKATTEQRLNCLEKLADKAIHILSQRIKDEFLQARLDDLTAGNFLKVFKATSFFEPFMTRRFSFLSKVAIGTLSKALDEYKDSKNKHLGVYLKRQLQCYVLAWLIVRIHKSEALGNNQKGDGERFKGRGFVQITGRHQYSKFAGLFAQKNSNYQLALKNISAESSQPAKDFLIKDPEQAAENNISAVIAVGGMVEGKFTGAKLRIFGTGESFNYTDARTIINSHDRDEEIAEYAKEFRTSIVQSQTIK